MIRAGMSNWTPADDRNNLDLFKFSQASHDAEQEYNDIKIFSNAICDLFEAETEDESTWAEFMECLLARDWAGLYKRFAFMRKLIDYCEAGTINRFYVPMWDFWYYQDWDSEGYVVWYAGVEVYAASCYRVKNAFSEYETEPADFLPYTGSLAGHFKPSLWEGDDSRGFVNGDYHYYPMAYEGIHGDDYKGRCNGFYDTANLNTNTTGIMTSKAINAYDTQGCRMEHITIIQAIDTATIRRKNAVSTGTIYFYLDGTNIPLVTFNNIPTADHNISNPQNIAFKGDIYVQLMSLNADGSTTWEWGYTFWTMSYNCSTSVWTPSEVHGRKIVTCESTSTWFAIGASYLDLTMNRYNRNRFLPVHPSNTVKPSLLDYLEGSYEEGCNTITLSMRGFYEWYPNFCKASYVNGVWTFAESGARVNTCIWDNWIPVSATSRCLHDSTDTIQYISADDLYTENAPWRVYEE